MAGFWIMSYLAVGALVALYVYFKINRALSQENRKPEVDDALDRVRRAVELFPGGMSTGLAAIALCWPMLVATVVVQRINGGKP